MLRIAKVAVDLSLDREFDYLIPEPGRPLIEIGSRVEVPFRSRSVAGFVVGFSDVSAFDDLKSIEKVLGEKSLVTETVMDLARWMSSYYLAPFEACVRSVLPAVVRNKESGEKKQLVVSLVEENVVATPLVDTVSSTCFFGFDPACPVSHLPGGNLPHWRQDGTTYFVTFRLADSLPKETLNQWQRERDEWMEKNPRPCAERDEDIASTEETFAQDVDAMSSSRLLEWQHEYRARFTERFDTWLDAGNGRCILKNPEIRKVVQEVLHCFCGARYELYSYVIMPNHVHVLVSPFGEYTLSNIIKKWKSVSTREMNALLGTKEAVWQKESFDHIVRSAESLAAFRTYISQNPVGLNADSYFLYDRDRDGGIASTVTPKQQAVIDYLKDNGSVLLSELTAIDGFSAATVKALEKKGLVTISNESVYRDPHAGIELLKTEPMRLMEQQAVALKQIIVAIDEPEPPVILLHGVTGSGKTEVYLQAIAHALEQDRGAIVLVPEIALTPQTVDRFRARFADKPERVAVLHSSLSDGERYDEWHRIRSGEAQIVIGARSA
ncbi:MAG: DEAD/DEAH box helicase, partial [Kiritimatiellaceae bacterium]|nr:DEAD/DEAH box helicase [Kiritimatiellaceae bacterium]